MFHTKSDIHPTKTPARMGHKLLVAGAVRHRWAVRKNGRPEGPALSSASQLSIVHKSLSTCPPPQASMTQKHPKPPDLHAFPITQKPSKPPLLLQNSYGCLGRRRY